MKRKLIRLNEINKRYLFSKKIKKTYRKAQ